MQRQFSKVNCRHGAPLGRKSDGYLEVNMPRFVRLFRVRLNSGGYDEGGAYWGLSLPLYCAIDDDGNMRFTRAVSRQRAAAALNIPENALKRGF